jgi:hypothetical protein
MEQGSGLEVLHIKPLEVELADWVLDLGIKASAVELAVLELDLVQAMELLMTLQELKVTCPTE